MKRLVLVALATLAPLGAAAQVPAPAGEARPTPGSERVVLYAAPTSATPERAEAVAGVDQTAAQRPPQPSSDDRRPRRRGSMVGYIEDPVVSSKIRFRFDAGFHNDAPDRAEFFYAKCGCYRDPSNPAALFDPKAPGPGPGAANNLNFQQVYVQGEYAFHERVSLFGELPLRWIQPQSFASGTGAPFDNKGGLSDIRLGAKLALADTDRQAITIQVRTFLPTGKASSGLGTDHASLEPALLWYQRLSDRISIESQIGDWHPFGGSAGIPTSGSDKFAGDVFFYGIGPSFDVYRSARVRFTPVVELVGWHVINGFQTATSTDASGINIVNLKFGARASWNGHGSFYAGYGHALTSASWYDNILRLEYRHSF